MIQTKIKYNGRRVTLAGVGPKKYQMFALAQQYVRLLRMRALSSIDSGDNAMPPLSKRHYAIKNRKTGQFVKRGQPYSMVKGSALRDLYGTGKDGGHMLDQVRVTFASPQLAKVNITQRAARVKARRNELNIVKRGGSGWWGASGRDVAALYLQARRIFGQNVQALRVQFSGDRRGTAMPGWMDPLGKMDALAGESGGAS